MPADESRLELATAPGAKPRYAWAARWFLVWLCGVLAVHTLLTHTAQVLGLPFRALVAGTSVAGACVTAWVALAVHRQIRERIPRPDGWASPLAGATVLACALLGVLSFRPDSDDYYYVPAAVHALEHPGEPMGFQVRGLVPATNAPIVSHNFSTSLAFEYLSAVAASLTGAEYLALYYLWMPALVSAAIAASHLLLAAQLRLDPVATVLGCAVGLACLTLMGETHRAYGSFAFARAFQGKVLLLSAGVPLFAAGTIEYFRHPRPGRWLFLAAAATAMLGATSTAIVLLPALATVLALSTAAAQGLGRVSIGRVAAYGLTLGYLIAYSLAYLAAGGAEGLGMESLVNLVFPQNFSGHVRLMIDLGAPVWPPLALAAGIVFFALAGREARLFAGCWIGACLALFLNPLVAGLLIEHVTSPNIYWRLFYLLPPAALVSAAAAVALDRLASRRGTQLGIGGTLALLAAAAQVAVPQASVFWPEGLGRPRCKLPSDALADARALVELPAPPGNMLAPAAISGIVPMLSSRYPQVLRRGEAELLWLDGGRSEAQTMRRAGATAFAETGTGGLQAFLQVVQELDPASIVLAPPAWQSLIAQGEHETLAALGYGEPQRVGRYLVLARRADGASDPAAK